MSQFVTFHEFAGNLGKGVHNLSSNTIKVALTNTAPSAANNTQLSNITQITAGNGYTSGGATVSGSTFAEKAADTGVWNYKCNDVTFTASGGSIGPFRYAVFYDDTATNDPLIGYLDVGSSVTLANGNSYTITIPSATGVVDIGAGTIS